METTVKERLERYCKSNGFSIRHFERKIDVSYGYFGHLQKNGISHEKVKKIINEFPDLNIDWLLNGEGEMLKNDSDGDTITQTVGGDNNGTMIGKHTGKYSGKFALFAGGDDISRLIATNKELLAQNRKSQEQIDRLIGIIEKMQGAMEN
jgi:hypothetical protein